MKNPFTRAMGYLAEGFTGLCGLEGAKIAAPSVAHSLMFQAAAPITIEQVQGIVGILMQVVVGVVTVWRMIRPKKALLVPADAPVELQATVAASAPADTSLTSKP